MFSLFAMRKSAPLGKQPAAAGRTTQSTFGLLADLQSLQKNCSMALLFVLLLSPGIILSGWATWHGVARPLLARGTGLSKELVSALEKYRMPKGRKNCAGFR